MAGPQSGPADANLRVEKTADSGLPKATQAPPEWDDKTVAALRSFADALGRSKTSDEIQGAAFESVRSSGTEPSKFFSAIYHILLGTERGPRLGPYIMDAGQEATANKILAALGDSGKEPTRVPAPHSPEMASGRPLAEESY